MGSVKDLKVIIPPEENSMGRGRFYFSDRYSVFDWGEMPDHIPYKGESIAILSGYFFEKLNERGIENHYVGLVEDNRVKSWRQLKGPTNIMEVQLVRVIRPRAVNSGYDYSVFRQLRGNFLLPLEVIYRNTLSQGSSLLKRLQKGEVTPQELGLQNAPEPGQRLPHPIIDFSTKLEVTDRYLKETEALEIAGLSEEEMQGLKSMALEMDTIITEEIERLGLQNEDGKFEFGFSPARTLMVVDVLGTLDECRFTYNGIPVSKEIARMYYRKTDWYIQTEEAKRVNRQNWKALVKGGPEPLPPRLKELISLIYRACTNEITGREWFPEVPPLRELLEEVREYI